jgi:hypothetical protein
VEPICIYCQSAPAEEQDHTLPQSWYPDGTDPKLQRLTVPACKKCGAELKKAEQQMAFALMMAKGFDRDHPAAAGVYERVRKTWDAVAAKTPRERHHRAQHLYSVLTRVQPVVVPPEQAIGAPRIKFRTPAGLVIDAVVGLKFRRSDFDAVAGKFVRGLHYHRTKTLLPVGTKFTSFEPPDEVMRQSGQQLPGGELSRGLSYRYSESEDGDGRAIWFFYLWEQVQMGVLVEPPGTAPIIT